MMKNKICLLVLSLFFLAGCGKDFLTKPPKTSLSDETYWTNESNIRLFSLGFYTAYFKSYGSGYTWGDYFLGRSQTLNDNYASGGRFAQTPSASSSSWSFTWVRKANLFLERVEKSTVTDQAKQHWGGVARFFRALEYGDLMRGFGGVPYLDKVPLESDVELLFKDRDPRGFVADKMLEDFQYAVDNVRPADGTAGLSVNKYVVAAFAARTMLFEASIQKYHPAREGGGDAARAEKYYAAAKAFAEVVMGGGYSIHPKYRELFNSMDLGSNKEMIMYRSYVEAVVTHSILSYVNTEGQTGTTKSLWDAYVTKNGLPITAAGNTQFEGYTPSEKMFANRDGRMSQSFLDTLRISGKQVGYSTTGVPVHKFLNDEIRNQNIGLQTNNPTDGPVIRLGEVLLVYAEACAELADMGKYVLTQSDLDKSINLLRKRSDTAVAPLQVMGGMPAVGGVVYDDPARDMSVPAMIWEIRRERRVELAMEGQRLNDLIRWRKLQYTDLEKYPDGNTGAWIDLTLPKYGSISDPAKAPVNLWDGGLKGFIKPIITDATIKDRTFDVNNPKNTRVYLNCIPTNEIKFYEDSGYKLTQNPDWDLK